MNTERGQIVAKLCRLIEKIDAKRLPAFVQHLLRLSKDENIILVFYYLRKYFDKRWSSDDNGDDVNKTTSKI